MASVVVADLDADARALTAQLLHAARHTVHPAADATALQTLLCISPIPLVAVVRLDAPELAHALLTLHASECSMARLEPLEPTEPTGQPAQTSPPPRPLPPQQAAPNWLLPWAQRHAYILVAEQPQVRLLATALVRLGPAFARFTPTMRSAHDAALLLRVVNEAADALNTTCP